ncbi:hypothetical protein AK88_01316 [Plasmodium fragile]|uniref:Uncharacterized protein n=1 Tax=Plasmodium fragile TaxID=5857 RepID=A0A0D9QPN2_PLAFR|nr:uncharacterized protein AK88_01316 [Plasmodium fragile]KJP89024.1 hypothetical protein AK88_01316 [Plasmodium fragile]
MHCAVFNLLIYETLLCKAIHTSKKLTSELKATNLFFSHPLCNEKKLFSKKINSFRDNYFMNRKSEKKTQTRNMYTLAENNHKSLIDNLKDRGIIDDDDVYETMLQVGANVRGTHWGREREREKKKRGFLT